MTQRVSKGRFSADDDASPRIREVRAVNNSNDLGLSQVDSSFAIGQSGGVVVVLQEFHDESAFDTGDFSVSKSRFDKRKDAQKDREEAVRLKKEEERKAAIALKKEEEARVAREAEAARRAAKKAADDEKRRKEREERQASKKAIGLKKEISVSVPVVVPPPPAAPQVTVPVAPAREEKKPAAVVELSEGSRAILHDTAIVGIGNVVKKVPVMPVSRVFVAAGVQTDPVRILPLIDQPVAVSSAATASAAWWLQQGHSSGSVVQQQAQPVPASNPTSSDQFMMHAYIDAMQRQQSTNYGYWTGAPQTSAADLYWQQQQGVYQSNNQAPQRYTAPRRV